MEGWEAFHPDVWYSRELEAVCTSLFCEVDYAILFRVPGHAVLFSPCDAFCVHLLQPCTVRRRGSTPCEDVMVVNKAE